MTNSPDRGTPETDSPDHTARKRDAAGSGPTQEAAAGPGAIAARETDTKGQPTDRPPPMAQRRSGSPAVGTPGASDQADMGPGSNSLSGHATNDQMPEGATTAANDRTPPDMQETPDPRGDAHDPPPPR